LYQQAIVGFDFDLTLTEKAWWDFLPYQITNWPEYWLMVTDFKEERILMQDLAYKLKPSMIPNQQSYIITNRPVELFKDLSIQWMEELRFPPMCMDMAPAPIIDNEDAWKRKAAMIMKYGITEFYEDDKYIRNELISNLPLGIKILPPEEAINRGRARMYQQFLL